MSTSEGVQIPMNLGILRSENVRSLEKGISTMPGRGELPLSFQPQGRHGRLRGNLLKIGAILMHDDGSESAILIKELSVAALAFLDGMRLTGSSPSAVSRHGITGERSHDSVKERKRKAAQTKFLVEKSKHNI